jgi:GTP-binding protein
MNKIDRADARIEEVTNDDYDLFIDLDASEEQIEFPVLYTNAKRGVAHLKPGDDSEDLSHLFRAIITRIPGPEGNDEATPQFLIANLDYDSYVGQIGIGRMINGTLEKNGTYTLCGKEGNTPGVKFTALYSFLGLKKKPEERVEAGDIVAVAGVENISIGDTISSLEDPRPLPRISIDEPTVSMVFYVNSSPFAGLEGKFLTSRHLRARLEQESLKNIALRVNAMPDRPDAFEVCGRGELQMAILIETMRREGFEFMVSRPSVISRKEGDRVLEPVERLYLDVPEEYVGIVTEKISIRKGRMVNLVNRGHGRVNLEFLVPSRGLIGFRSHFLTDTKGSGVMNTLFEGYEPWAGSIPQRVNGAMVADRVGKVTAYASLAMADRGELFVEVGTEVYGGMVIGERNRNGDLNVNIIKEKKLSNVRSSTSEATVTLRPPRLLSLEQSIEFIAADELVEVTPRHIRLRKMELDQNRRLSMKRREERMESGV